MRPPARAWWPVALGMLALGGAGGRVYQSTRVPERFGDATAPAAFVAGQTLLHPDAPCDEDARPARLLAHERALRAQDPERRLVRLGEQGLHVGEWRGVPVVFRPCEGTFALLPSRFEDISAVAWQSPPP